MRPTSRRLASPAPACASSSARSVWTRAPRPAAGRTAPCTASSQPATRSSPPPPSRRSRTPNSATWGCPRRCGPSESRISARSSSPSTPTATTCSSGRRSSTTSARRPHWPSSSARFGTSDECRRHPPDRSEGRRCGRGGHGHGRTAPHRHHRHRRQRSPAERRAEHRVLRHDASSPALPGREVGRNRAWDARPDRGRGSPVSPSAMPGTGPPRPCPASPAPRSGSSSPPSSPSGR